MRRFVGTIIVIMGLVGCGYKPASHMIRESVGDKISTQIVISMTDPENSVLIKDALNQAVLTEFGSRIVPQGASDTHIKVALQSLSFVPLQRDSQGYIIFYRTVSTLTFTVEDTKGGQKVIQTTGSYDFPIAPSSIISEAARYESIKESSAKAIEQFVARLAIESRIKH